MVPVSKYGCEQAVKNWKKDEYQASSAVDLYMQGAPQFGYKKDVTKALKILKYWETRTKRDKTFTIYYQLRKVYKELGKTKEYEYYDFLFNKFYYGGDNTRVYSLDECIKYWINASIGKNNKIIDKKFFNEHKYLLDEFIGKIKKGETPGTFYKSKNAIIKLISTDQYGMRNKAIEMLLDYMTNTSLYLKSLTPQEMQSYLDLFPENQIPKTEFHKYIKTYMDYFYNKKDDKSKCEYAAYYMGNGAYLEKDPKKALEMFMETYNNGYEQAADYILKYYERFGTEKDQIDFLSKHVKKYEKDIQLQLRLADICYKKGLVNDTIEDEKSLQKAINIYESNLEAINDEQKERLAHVYNHGYGVEQDFAVAKKYAKSTSMMQKIEKEKIKQVTKVKLKSKDFKKEVDEIIHAVEQDFDNIDALYELWWLIFYGIKVEKDNDLLYNLAQIIYEKNPGDIGSFIMATCYFKEINVKMDDKIFLEYLNVALVGNNASAYNLYFIYLISKKASKEEIVAALEKGVELGSYNATLNKAYELKRGEFYEKNDVKAFELFEYLYNTKGYLKAALPLAQCYKNGVGVEKDEEKAYKLYLVSANQFHNPEACYHVFLYNRAKKFKDLNEKTAFKYLKIAADAEYSLAYDYLGDCYRIGRGTDINHGKAFKYYKKASDCGYEYAHYRLGFYYRDGVDKILSKDINKAISYFEKGKAYNEAQALYELGVTYYYNEYNNVDYKKAFNYFKQALEKGDQGANVMLAMSYEKGLGVEVNPIKAAEYYKAAYETKYEYSMEMYLLYIVEGIKGYSEPNYEEGIKVGQEILKLYPQNVAAHIDTGYSYEHLGQYNKAFEHYKAALKYNPDSSIANYNMGIFYKNGYSVEKDEKKAIEYYENAARLNYANAYLRLAEIYKDEKSKLYDQTKTYTYIKKAYDAKVEEAKGYLADYYIWKTKEYKKAYDILADSKRETTIELEAFGDLFYNGYYVKQNYDIAYKNYKKAYDLDKYASIQFKMGRCYHFGHGVEQDKDKAYDLLYLSAKLEYQSAINFIKEFYKK